LLNFLSPRSERTGPKQKDSKVLENLSFFDLGCGSGIHSAAAAYAGASHVISFDRQEASLQVTRVLQRIAQRKPWVMLSAYAGSRVEILIVLGFPES